MTSDPKQAIRDVVRKVEQALPGLVETYGKGDPRVVLARLFTDCHNGSGGVTPDVLKRCDPVTGPVRLGEAILQWVQ